MNASITLTRPEAAVDVPSDTSRMVSAQQWRHLARRHAWAARHDDARACIRNAERIEARP